MFGENKSVIKNTGFTDRLPSFFNLTPMTDTLTHLLFFLLVGWASQAVTIEGVQGVQLPPSSSDREVAQNLTIVVNMDAIKIQNSSVVTLKNGELTAKYLEGAKIIPLYNALVRIIEQKKAKGLEPTQDSSIILLMADKKLKSDLITKIMKTCGMAGIVNFHFGVAKT